MKFISALVAALALTGSLAQAQEVRKATLFYQFDVDSGTVTYPLYTGQGNSPWNADNQGDAPISTVGSSTTVTATTANSLPFATLVVGDLINVTVGSTASTRLITAKASGDSVTVNAAIDLSAQATGYAFRWRKSVGGTAATSGWFDVAPLQSYTISVQYDQGDLDALGIRWECRATSLDTQPVYVHPGAAGSCGGGTLASGFCTFATAGANQGLAVVIAGNWDSCRVGLKFVTTDTSDAGAAVEKVTATIVGTTWR
jgi:hypothetical protein